ncbi:hypothetical protein E8E13_001720 [Curvularia kusanoi]|uniref:Amino acid transporter n=1 Tax=Curvularia kusanoi TaxID=90978 RepID=A0A9P4WEA8_CURKU|nr:hypothetical protein E8E13_001720 [Curvularia kusanoi]
MEGDEFKNNADFRIASDVSSALDADARDLANRNLTPIAILDFSCNLMVTWEGLFSVFVFGPQNGGPSGLIYGFLFTIVGYSCVAASMGELVSLWPTAGGQYHWVYVLAPDRRRAVLSYFIGWQSVIAWQATAAGGAYVSATSTQGLVINSQPSYIPERWHGTLIAILLVTLCGLFSTFLSKGLPYTEIAALWLHVLLFIALLVAFTVIDGGYESRGVSFFVGLITSVFVFSGVDGAVHMCEEVHNASRIVPWAMMGSVFINGITGFDMLFCGVNVFAVVFWIAHGRKVYTGPVLETQIESIHGRSAVGREV